jgi:hypothetical protein
MAQSVKVEVKPYMEPEFIKAWLGMAEAMEKSAIAIRKAGERLAKLYEKKDVEDDRAKAAV